jgi:TonB family protein
MRARIQGIVEVEAVVLEDGSVGAVRIRRSLDRIYGLDEKALAAAKLWRFLPARDRTGAAVRAVVVIALEFRLH